MGVAILAEVSDQGAQDEFWGACMCPHLDLRAGYLVVFTS